MSEDIKTQDVSDEVQTRVLNSFGRQLRRNDEVLRYTISSGSNPGDDCILTISFKSGEIDKDEIEDLLTQHNPYLYNGSAYNIKIRESYYRVDSYTIDFYICPYN